MGSLPSKHVGCESSVVSTTDQNISSPSSDKPKPGHMEKSRDAFPEQDDQTPHITENQPNNGVNSRDSEALDTEIQSNGRKHHKHKTHSKHRKSKGEHKDRDSKKEKSAETISPDTMEKDPNAADVVSSQSRFQFQPLLDNVLQTLKSHTSTIRNRFDKNDKTSVTSILHSLSFVGNSFYKFSTSEFTLEQVRSARIKISELLTTEQIIDTLCQLSMFLNGEDEDLSDMFYIWKSCVGILVNTSGFAEGVGQQICASHGFLEWMEKTLTIWYTPHLKKRLKVGCWLLDS